MGRLIIAAHLPDHRITVLMVMPERIVTPLRFRWSRIDTDVVIARTHDNLLAPVAQDVTLIAGCTLCVVIGH